MWAARVALAVAVRCGLVAVGSLGDGATGGPSAPGRVMPLGSESNAFDRSLVEAFQQGLREAGFVEGRFRAR